jgi:hypothetical protein
MWMLPLKFSFYKYLCTSFTVLTSVWKGSYGFCFMIITGTSVCMHMCVSGVVCVHMCMVCACSYVCVQQWWISAIPHEPCSWFYKDRVHHWPSLPSQYWDTSMCTPPHPGFWHGFWAWNAVAHACWARTLLTKPPEPSLQRHSFNVS